jgi:hypothetical protein
MTSTEQLGWPPCTYIVPTSGNHEITFDPLKYHFSHDLASYRRTKSKKLHGLFSVDLPTQIQLILSFFTLFFCGTD